MYMPDIMNGNENIDEIPTKNAPVKTEDFTPAL
jgi:hypothetical protein